MLFKKKAAHKTLSLLLGLIFAVIVLEISLRVLGYVQNFKIQKVQNFPQGQYRVLTLGNSYTAGIGAPPDKSYPQQLNVLLNKKKNDFYQVINKGKGAVNSSYVRENTQDWLQEFKPQLVFIMIGEPNSWNKYGYWEFLKSKNYVDENPVKKSLEAFRWLKIFKLVELFSSREETWNKPPTSKFSNTFKSILISESTASHLGYLWLGNLFMGTGYDVYKISDEQADEAIYALAYIYKHHKSFEAGELLAELLRYKKKDYDSYLNLMEEITDQRTSFNIGTYRVISKNPGMLNDEQRKRRQKIIDKLKSKNTDSALTIFYDNNHSYQDLNTLNMRKHENLTSRYYEIYPANIMIAKMLIEGAPTMDPNRAMDIIEKSNSLNPLSPINNLTGLAQFISNDHPELRPRMEKVVDEMNQKLGMGKLNKNIPPYVLEEEWIISDLEQIITMVQKSGAHPIVQTYPPLKNGTDRFSDLVLRKWWDARVNKDNIQFMDVGLSLTKLFDIKNGGNQYYTLDFGPVDNHQNAEGYYEIAKLMFPYVMSRSN